MDGFIGYRGNFTVSGKRTAFTVQVNVRNLTDEATSMPLRYNANFTARSRVLLYEPRSFRLTVGLDF